MPTNNGHQTRAVEGSSVAKTISNLERRARLVRSLASYRAFAEFLSQESTKSMRFPGKVLYELSEVEPGCRELLDSYFQQASLELNRRSRQHRARAEKVVSVLQNLGIGEVVFVSPEGPQAKAGGLAQVICGLAKSFDQARIPSTLISLLYEEEKTGEHASAETILRDGLLIDEELVTLTYAGEISIPFGPSVWHSSSREVTPAEIVTANVYVTEKGLQRMFFLHNPRFTKRLYAQVSNEQLLRNAIFLARGSLELLKDPQFDIQAHILISNDWLTGLIPAFLKTDPSYLNDPALSKIETVHVLHNCGVDYQGRIPVNESGVDLWPILRLEPQHYFGIADPQDHFLLNLTAAAVFHVGKAVLTVSKPYAEELLVESNAGALNSLMRAKRNIVFGISNGIDTAALERAFAAIRLSARKLANIDGPSDDEKRLPATKQHAVEKEKTDAKAVVQQRYGMPSNKSAILVALVGRLTEQKGIGLFSSTLGAGKPALLDALLSEYPKLEVLIAGPGRKGDPAFERLRALIQVLSLKYHGRVRGEFSFLKHELALAITRASDLFLMPSRYEPGGIAQLEALAAGTPVVARNVGGISATLVDFDPETGAGNAFLFKEYAAESFYAAMRRAITAIENRDTREQLVQAAVSSEHDWNNRMPKYRALLQHVAGVISTAGSFSPLEPQRKIVNEMRPFNQDPKMSA